VKSFQLEFLDHERILLSSVTAPVWLLPSNAMYCFFEKNYPDITWYVDHVTLNIFTTLNFNCKSAGTIVVCSICYRLTAIYQLQQSVEWTQRSKINDDWLRICFVQDFSSPPHQVSPSSSSEVGEVWNAYIVSKTLLLINFPLLFCPACYLQTLQENYFLIAASKSRKNNSLHLGERNERRFPGKG